MYRYRDTKTHTKIQTGIQVYRDTLAQIHIDTQTHIQTRRCIHRHIDTYIKKRVDRHVHTHIDIKRYTQTHGQIHRHKDTHTCRHTGTHTETTQTQAAAMYATCPSTACMVRAAGPEDEEARAVREGFLEAVALRFRQEGIQSPR